MQAIARAAWCARCLGVQAFWVPMVALVVTAMPATAYDILTAADGAGPGPQGYCAARAAGHAAPPTMAVHYAQGFRLEYGDGFKLITVTKPWRNAPRIYRYVVACADHGPLPSADLVLQHPLRRAVYLSSTHLGQVDVLAATDTVSGVHNPAYVASPAVQARLAAGAATTVGHGAQVDPERVLRLQPDLVMAFALGNASDVHPQLEAAGVPVVLGAEFMEATPLGRTEWLKFTAALLDREAAANRLMAKVIRTYREVAELVATMASPRPRVIAGALWRGVWYAPAGDSYLAKLIADAGGAYTWADRKGELSVVVDLETVLREGAAAAVWLTSTSYTSLEDAFASEPRLGLLGPVRAGRVYNNSGGRRDYWEYGVVNPHVALADLVEIFYPGTIRDHQLTFFVRHNTVGE